MSNVQMTISRNIRKYRLQRHQSQEELAYKSKICAAHLSKIERGNHNITIITLERIADALEVDIRSFFDESVHEQYLSAGTVSFMQRYISEIEQLPQEQLKLMQSVLDSLLSLTHE